MHEEQKKITLKFGQNSLTITDILSKKDHLKLWLLKTAATLTIVALSQDAGNIPAIPSQKDFPKQEQKAPSQSAYIDRNGFHL